MSTPEIYVLEPILDDPRYNGFHGAPFLFHWLPQNRTTRKWRVKRFARTWITPKVNGIVRKCQDYPGIDIVSPAFSERAVEVLRDFLEPNGEILPINTRSGKYFAYNLTR